MVDGRWGEVIEAKSLSMVPSVFVAASTMGIGSFEARADPGLVDSSDRLGLLVLLL